MRQIVLSGFAAGLALTSVSPAEAAEQPSATVDGTRIMWDYRSIQCIAPGGAYARVRRLDDGSLVAVYDRRGNTEKIRSYDDGRSWSEPQVLFPAHMYYGAGGDSVWIYTTNAEIYQLRNGTLIAGCNYRPSKPDIAPYAIVVSLSDDMGANWSEPRVLYEAGTNFGDGCWEPSFLQLPSGELQVYFANEGPYTTNADQEITLMSSADNGATWSEPRMVCFREGHRDGMPVAQVIGDEIVLSIEDNGYGELQPYILRTALADNWREPVLGDGPRREPAHLLPLPADVYAGAPYTLVLPTGETLVSYQTTERRHPDWERSTLEVAVGDRTMRRFAKATRPIDVPLDRSAMWNSLALWDRHTVVAVTSASFREPYGVWIVKGYILPPHMEARHDKVKVDGLVTPKEWGRDLPIFVGTRGPAQIRAAVGARGRTLCFGALVADTWRENPDAGISFYLAPDNSDLGGAAYRVWCPAEGAAQVFRLDDGGWTEIPAGDVRVGCLRDPNGNGYSVECSVPFGVVGKRDDAPVRVSVGLSALTDDGAAYEELLANSESGNPATWYRIDLQ
ncbi:MAG: exo-alpha-sialidase [Rikenellaceae bacterium]|nr:exo-alpha-sialidase [Rikenellaceae bacterium]